MALGVTAAAVWADSTLPGQSLTVSYQNSVVPSAVPLPPAVYLFGTALIGLVASGRRKIA